MYKWDHSLETGYMKIDNQHIELFSKVNKLIDASNQGKDKEIIFKVLKFLTEYVVMHFQTEEDLMIRYHYEDYAAHKKIHDDFKATVGELSAQLNEKGPTREMIALVTKTINAWLVNHIKGDDYHMATYIKAKDAR